MSARLDGLRAAEGRARARVDARIRELRGTPPDHVDPELDTAIEALHDAERAVDLAMEEDAA
jgi:hypothetical protein